MINYLGLPTDADIEVAASVQQDSFYKLPDYIAEFLDQVKDKLPEGWSLHPWTINQSLSLKYNGNFKYGIAYEGIEDGGMTVEGIINLCKHGIFSIF